MPNIEKFIQAVTEICVQMDGRRDRRIHIRLLDSPLGTEPVVNNNLIVHAKFCFRVLLSTWKSMLLVKARILNNCDLKSICLLNYSIFLMTFCTSDLSISHPIRTMMWCWQSCNTHSDVILTIMWCWQWHDAGNDMMLTILWCDASNYVILSMTWCWQ